MKQILKTIAFVAAFAASTLAASAVVTKNDTTVNLSNNTVVITPADSANSDEVEAFSDTTDTAGVDNSTFDPWDSVMDEWPPSNGNTFFDSIGIDSDSLMGMVFALCVLLVIFVLAPVALIGLILYFVYKNRKQRMRLAEMAMSKGQAIPFDAMGSPVSNVDMLWNKGIKQIFLGAGLGILLWIPIGKLGLAIGALILLIGCGNMVIAHQEREKQRQKTMYDNFFNKGTSENGNAQ